MFGYNISIFIVIAGKILLFVLSAVASQYVLAYHGPDNSISSDVYDDDHMLRSRDVSEA